MTIDWIFGCLAQVVTSVTNWFLQLLDAAGLQSYFFYTLAVGCIMLGIFRFRPASISMGDAMGKASRNMHEYFGDSD